MKCNQNCEHFLTSVIFTRERKDWGVNMEYFIISMYGVKSVGKNLPYVEGYLHLGLRLNRSLQLPFSLSANIIKYHSLNYE